MMMLDEAVRILDEEHPAPTENGGTLFSRRLRRLMIKGGITQEALSKKIGCSHSAVGYWVRGKRTPTVDIAVKIAKSFGVSTDYLTGADGETEEDSEPIEATKGAIAWDVVKKELNRYMSLGTVEELEQALYSATL